MTARSSKLVLTSHITFSVGWLGAVAVFIVLAITGLTTMDNQLSRSVLIAMDMSAWFVIVPFCLASFFTGLIQALGTRWGLFKHYWIVVKLFLTIAMTILLLLHMQPISYLANVATETSFQNSRYAGQLLDIITKAGAAILVLVFITTISVYKPWGKIQLKQTNNTLVPIQDNTNKSKRSWTFFLLVGLGILIVFFIIIKHILDGGMHAH
ncbi:MAG: hypothetical protein ABIN36_16355 [Ferruginibacter sp.]